MPRIAILTGWTSSEREVALRSAQAVRGWLEARHDVEVFDVPADLDRFIASRKMYDVVVPVFHGKGGEDGMIQGFLKTLGVPFIFSDVEAHAIGMDKVVTKALVSAVGIRTAASKVVKKGDVVPFERPSVVKVPDAGSSIGVFLAKDEDSFQNVLKQGFEMSEALLIEDFISGREFTIPVVEHAGSTEALPIIEIRSTHAFFDLESKYDPSLAEEICPAPIEDDLAERLSSLAVRSHRLIGARHVSRTDFIVDGHGEPWFIEINTIPGMTNVSLLPKSVAVAGLTMEGLLDEWIESVLL